MNNANDVEIPFIGQLMMQPADDVQLGGAARLSFLGPMQNLLVRHDVALLALQVGPEGAEDAAIDADVGRVEMRVDVVVGGVAVLALADGVGEFAEREEIGVISRKRPSSNEAAAASTLVRMSLIVIESPQTVLFILQTA